MGLITDATNGRIVREPDMEFYPPGTQVRLTAIANPGYRFDHWEYDTKGTNNPYILTMTQSSTAQAVFVPGTDPGPGPGPGDQPKVEIALHAGITITGQSGRRYVIQATPDLAQTNSWTALGEITLTNTTQIWYDPSPVRQGQKMYRVILGQ